MSVCVSCGSWSSVVKETRRDTRFNWRWRFRECKECSHRWATYELPESSLDVANTEPINPDGALER